MDPLSVAASVIAVLQAANVIVAVCYDFKALMTDAPWTLTHIIAEIQDLRGVLETLDRLASPHLRDDSESVSINTKRRSFEILCEPQTGPLATCLRELKALEGMITSRHAGKSESKARALLQAMGWQLKEKEVRLALERIHRCKVTLNLAITADEAVLLLDIQDMTASLATSVQQIDSTLQNFILGVRAKELDEKEKNLLRWLSPTDPLESHQNAMKVHQRGTNSWFVECPEFTQWYAAPRAFLWLSGFPGAGKTVLFSNTVQYLSERLGEPQNDFRLAFYYCDFRRSETQDVSDMAGSLVAQICSQTGWFPEELEHARQHSSGGPPSQKHRPSLALLVQVLEKLAAKSKLILLVDALDECGQRQDALMFFADLQKSIPNTLVLVTSRDEVEIQSGLHSYQQVRIERHLREVNHDVESYIHHRLSSDRQLQWLNPPVKQEIAAHLIDKSCGMFRWVQCQLDSISSLRTVKAIRTALQELPKGLDETYERILSRVSPSDVEIVRRILLWVSFGVMPLTLREVHEAIAIEPGVDYLDEESRLRSPRDILDLCGSLLSVSDRGHVRLAHLSVKEYLLSPAVRKRDAIAMFALDPSSASFELANLCLTYLTFSELSSGPCQTAESYTDRLIRYPLLQYASICWTYFVRDTVQTPDLRRVIASFFHPCSRPTFMSWVQVLNAENSDWDFYPAHATPLYYASSFGLIDTVKDLIAQDNIDLDAPGSRFGGTALHAAVLREHAEVMRLLLDAGANPNQCDWGRITPLHSASLYGSEEVIMLLLSRGADQNAKDDEGCTPGDWAIEGGSVEAQRLMLRTTELSLKGLFVGNAGEPIQKSAYTPDATGGLASRTRERSRSKSPTVDSFAEITVPRGPMPR